jgi:hypothetical protein
MIVLLHAVVARVAVDGTWWAVDLALAAVLGEEVEGCVGEQVL